MKVTGWTDWSDETYEELPDHLYEEAYGVVAAELSLRGYKFTGCYHQNGDYGVPIIDDKWKFTASQRTWGGIMVDAYPCEIDDSDNMGYVVWAWVAPEPMVIPNIGKIGDDDELWEV